FSGASAGNAIYVDFLELDTSVSSDLENTLAIDPDFTIYFADANVPVEQLDGQFDGHLRWVSEFNGPNSSVDVLLRSGKTVKMNRALRNSASIDSDGDGIANGDDIYPLDADPTEPPQISNVTITSTAPLAAAFSLSAKPNKV